MYHKFAHEMAKVWHKRPEHFVPAYHGFFLPSMNIAESGQSGMHAQQPHGKMLSLVDATHKDISKQMCQDAMLKAAARNQPVDMGKSLNLDLNKKNVHQYWLRILLKVTNG